MKRVQYYFVALILIGTAFLYTSCDPDEPEPGPEETITSVTVTLTDTLTNKVVTASFKDPDGPGGSDPTQEDAILLDPNSTYRVTMEFLNESVSPVEDITPEISSEGDEHLVCFTFTVGFALAVTYEDLDANNIGIGLETLWTTGDAGDGNVRITLKHQPEGIKDGTCDPGETDVEVDFWTIIQ